MIFRAIAIVSLLLAIATPGGAQTLTIQTKSPLYNGSINDTYNLQFVAVGTSPYIWTVASGSLPSGLTLSPSGLLSGTPTATSHTSFTIQVTDGANMTRQGTFVLSVLTADNRYCNARNVVNFAGIPTDGPAALPQTCYFTTRLATPSPAANCMAHTSSDLSNILAGTQNCANGLPLACGDTILLDTGAVYAGNFIFPAKSCDDQHYITVQSLGVKDARWAAEGARISPCYAGVPPGSSQLPGRPEYTCPPGGAVNPVNLMAKLLFTAKGGSGPIDLATNNADHYRFIGIEITRQSAPATTVFDLVQVGQGHHIVFDQVWCHGVEPPAPFPESATTFTETGRCILLGQSNHVAVINSYLNDFYCTSIVGTSCDAQAIAGGVGTIPNTGWGTYKVVNNFLEGAAETIEIGGGIGPDTTNTPGGIDSPVDFEVRRNYMFKPITQWLPPTGAMITGWPLVKNLYEMKNGQRALVEGNLLQNVWAGFSQDGAVVLLTPKNQSGANGSNLCPSCVVTDITIRYNSGSTAAQTFQIANVGNTSGAFAQAGHNYSIHDNVIDNLLYAGCFACSTGTSTVPITESPAVPASLVLSNVFFNHNTMVRANPGIGTPVAMIGLSGAMINTGRNVSNITFTNNVGEEGQVGTDNTQGGGNTANCAFQQIGGKDMINACWSPYVFGGNAIVTSPSSKIKWPVMPSVPMGTPNCLSAPDFASIFVNYNNGLQGDYHLKACQLAATDKSDPGANIDLVISYTMSVQQ
ncbi:MAG TPA: Ig domain-containing protein [Candidatus Angelobacter sp.]|nr:Ig domain-containing protein [Candidatus Angelobacter sp.]